MGVSETPEGIILSARVKTESPAFRLTKDKSGIVIEVKSPAREGKANQEMMRELPRLLRCEVRMLRGSKARTKMFLLKGITPEELDLVLESQ